MTEAEGVLERMARARYESHVVQSRNVGGELRAWEDYHPEYKAAEIEAMRAALAALVPPSVEMVEAMIGKVDEPGKYVTRGYINEDDLIAAFTAAIESITGGGDG